MHACNNCYTHEGTENYGASWLCKKCERIVNLIARKTKRLDFKIQTRKHSIDALMYYDLQGHIELNSGDFEGEGYTPEQAVSHESVHYAIHKVAGVKASFQFDNLQFWGTDVYVGFT